MGLRDPGPRGRGLKEPGPRGMGLKDPGLKDLGPRGAQGGPGEVYLHP